MWHVQQTPTAVINIYSAGARIHISKEETPAVRSSAGFFYGSRLKRWKSVWVGVFHRVKSQDRVITSGWERSHVTGKCGMLNQYLERELCNLEMC